MRIPSKGQRTVWVAALLYMAGPAMSGSVRVQPIEDCSQRPKITVLRDGNPAARIPIEIYVSRELHGAQYEKKVGKTLRTQSDGTLLLPKVPPGVVHVIAHWSSGSIRIPDRQADLYMRYFPDDPMPRALFTMDLQPRPNKAQSVEQTAKEARRLVAERVPGFGGVVVDPSGATIGNVSIELAPLQAGGGRPAQEIRTNAQGQFAVHLPAGEFIAIFEAAGFQQTVRRVTIDSTARESEMRIVLRPDAMTE